jgi:hypothetical protein
VPDTIDEVRALDQGKPVPGRGESGLGPAGDELHAVDLEDVGVAPEDVR